MKVILDTCVVMDFLQRREPYADQALQILRFAAAERFSGYVTAKAVTDIYYLTHKCTHSDQETRQKLRGLLGILRIADTTAEDVLTALDSEIADFEDGVMIETARHIHADAIVTRNPRDYRRSAIPVYAPEAFLKQLDREMKASE